MKTIDLTKLTTKKTLREEINEIRHQIKDIYWGTNTKKRYIALCNISNTHLKRIEAYLKTREQHKVGQRQSITYAVWSAIIKLELFYRNLSTDEDAAIECVIEVLQNIDKIKAQLNEQVLSPERFKSLRQAIDEGKLLDILQGDGATAKQIAEYFGIVNPYDILEKLIIARKVKRIKVKGYPTIYKAVNAITQDVVTSSASNGNGNGNDNGNGDKTPSLVYIKRANTDAVWYASISVNGIEFVSAKTQASKFTREFAFALVKELRQIAKSFPSAHSCFKNNYSLEKVEMKFLIENGNNGSPRYLSMGNSTALWVPDKEKASYFNLAKAESLLPHINALLEIKATIVAY